MKFSLNCEVEKCKLKLIMGNQKIIIYTKILMTYQIAYFSSGFRSSDGHH